MAQQFYMVFVAGQRGPTVRHPDCSTARAEAQRLAKQTGKETYVLKAIEEHKAVTTVSTTQLQPPQPKPYAISDWATRYFGPPTPF